jgi:hypothetical protein
MTAEPPATVEPGRPRQTPVMMPAAFGAEVRAAVRYERGLVAKALAVLVVLAVILVLRALYFA